MNTFMQEAVKEAERGLNKNHGGPFGAVIVKDGKVIAKAHNCVLKDKDATKHAEMIALRKASKKLHSFDLSGCEMYTTGKPCPMCRGAIMWAKIQKVYYGCGYEDAKQIGFNEESGNSDNYEEMQKGYEACKELYKKYLLLNRKAY